MGGGRRQRWSTRRGDERLDLLTRNGVGDDELFDAVAEVRHCVLQIGDALFNSGLLGVEFVLGSGQFEHRRLEFDDPLVAFAEHGKDALELLIGLHPDLQTRAVVVSREDRESDTRCYRPTPDHGKQTNSIDFSRWNWVIRTTTIVVSAAAGDKRSVRFRVYRSVQSPSRESLSINPHPCYDYWA